MCLVRRLHLGRFARPPLTIISPTSRSWCYPTTPALVFLSFFSPAPPSPSLSCLRSRAYVFVFSSQYMPRIPDILFQFFHPDCIICVISASKSPFYVNVAPRYLHVFTRSKFSPCILSPPNLYYYRRGARVCVCVCVCVCVLCKIGPISARTLSFRHQTSRKFFSHTNFPIPYLWTAFCVPLSFVFLRKTIIYMPRCFEK